jgi:hypothetical protein
MQELKAVSSAKFPTLSALTITRHRERGVERVMGIEPTLAAWEAAVLPLNYTRVQDSHFTWKQGADQGFSRNGGLDFPVYSMLLTSRPKASTFCQSVNSLTVAGSVGPPVRRMISRIMFRSSQLYIG